MEMTQIRQSREGAIAVRDMKWGGDRRPWTVIWIPPHAHYCYVTQSLTDQHVANWISLTPQEMSCE